MHVYIYIYIERERERYSRAANATFGWYGASE